MKRVVPALLFCCCAAAPIAPSPSPSPSSTDPLCAALKSNVGRAIVTQKRVTDDITKLVAALSEYSKDQSYGETGSAYTAGFSALEAIGHVNDDLALLEKQLQQAAPLTSADGATIEKDLHAVADAQKQVADDSNALLNEWNQHVQLDANTPGTTGIGSHGANPFAGLGGNGSGQSSGIAVMEVRPLLISTLKTMDRASAALSDMHPALARAITACFSRVRRQSSGGPGSS
ncbi:MAG TPA: hypothetical protein VFL13_03065 [Candidatus Baltobacteraceae bacterium]|nr:hypothetical protein [Candidatus Baltobacteraceae bacterium]